MILYTFAVDGVEAPKSTKLPLKLQPYAGLLALLLIYLTLATIYLSIVPPLEGFDAMAHMNAINYWREEQRLPVVDLATNQYSYELLTQPPLYYMLSAAALRWLPADDAATFVRASANRYFPGLSTRQSIDLPTLPRTVAWALFIARLISLLGGTVAVIATWLWVRVALPDQQWLPFAVSAVMVGNPLFLFISTSITNDAWAAAGTVVVIYLVTCLAADPPRSLVPWFFAGVVAGLAALTKYSVLLVAVPALVILLQYRCYRPLPRFLAISVALFAGALLTAGWWYGRNLLLYGQPVPLERVSAVITTLERPTLMTPTEVWELLPFLFYSYWGLFVATFAPARFFAVIQWAVLVALIGLPVGLSRWRHRRESTRVLWLALIWFVLNLISMINYMRLISYGEQARFFLTAAPAIALLLLFGWQAWLPARFVPRLRLLLLPALVLLALWPLPTLRTAYRQPSTAAADEVSRPVNVHFQGGMTVVGYSLPAGGALVADQTLPLTLYLTTNQPIAGDYTLFLQLVDSEERLLYQYDGAPAKGRHPTRQWQPGRLFADPYALTVTAPVRTDTVATLLMGFYEYESPTARLPLFDATGRPIGDRLILGEIRLLAEPPPRANGAANPMARWAGGPDLLDAVVTQRDAERYTVDLTWRTTALLPTDYTVFVQFLDTNDQVVAQHDQEPRNGQAPTSTWLTNERIHDTVELHVPSAWSRVIVGLYNAQTGERLPLHGEAANQDFFVLPSIQPGASHFRGITGKDQFERPV